jgi:hypothetical protein
VWRYHCKIANFVKDRRLHRIISPPDNMACLYRADSTRDEDISLSGDIYSMAILIWQLLTGNLQNRNEILQRLMAPLSASQQVLLPFSETLSKVLSCCLASADKRPSASELADCLKLEHLQHTNQVTAIPSMQGVSSASVTVADGVNFS